MTSEQCYAYEKATDNGRLDAANYILKVTTGKEAKDISKKIYTKRTWEEDSTVIMKEILEEKAKQNETVIDYLMSTGEKIIAECVQSDTFWYVLEPRPLQGSS